MGDRGGSGEVFDKEFGALYSKGYQIRVQSFPPPGRAGGICVSITIDGKNATDHTKISVLLDKLRNRR